MLLPEKYYFKKSYKMLFHDDIFVQKYVAFFDRYGIQAFSGTLIVLPVNDEKDECLKMPLPYRIHWQPQLLHCPCCCPQAER